MLLCFAAFSCALVLSHGSRSCEEERESAEEEYMRILYNTDELTYFYVPRCDAAGDWEPLQMDHNNMRWCVDAVSGDVISQKSELLTSCNGCLAGRLVRMKDVEIAQKAGAKINNVYFPECQDVYPEYYEEKQCWVGYFNACWCVEPVTGAATSMPSENDPTCETRQDSVVSWCNIMEDLTRSYYRAYHTIKTRHYEQDPARALDAAQTRVPDVLFHVQCDQQGNFVEDQCLDGVCWCVDPLTGLPTDNCDSRSKRNTWHLCHQNRVLQLEAYYEFVLRGVMLEHFTIPKCTRLGKWDVMQCANQTEQNTCWCVDAVTGETTTNASRALRSCDSCRAHAMRSEYSGIEQYTSCDESGRYYTTVQCDVQLDQCWCVDHVGGEVLYFNPEREITGVECEEYDRVYHGRLG